MIDKKLIGYEFPAVTLKVEEGRLKFFAKALGENRGIYVSTDEAKKAGFPGILAPLTFPFVLEIDSMELIDLVKFLGESLEKLLHGEENFRYHRPIYAGDKITVRKKIIDIIDKKEGALQFVIFENNFTNQEGFLVAETKTNYVFKNN